MLQKANLNNWYWIKILKSKYKCDVIPLQKVTQGTIWTSKGHYDFFIMV